MKLTDLLALASSGYPDDSVQVYVEQPDEDHGDTLAEFVCRELQDTFEPGLPDVEQLAEARRVMENAIRDLQGVVQALDPSWRKTFVDPAELT